jgi:hypothetical protein
MNKWMLGVMTCSIVVLVAIAGYYVWFSTTEEECFIGMNQTRFDCLDGKRRR